MSIGSDLQATREATVREHIASEQRGDFAATLDTFHHARYEIMAISEVFDGHQQVYEMQKMLRAAFPDWNVEPTGLHHADDAVIVEGNFTGTHLGSFGEIAPTGREVACPMAAFFIFEDDRLVCERLYFDAATMFGQPGDPEPRVQGTERAVEEGLT